MHSHYIRDACADASDTRTHMNTHTQVHGFHEDDRRETMSVINFVVYLHLVRLITRVFVQYKRSPPTFGRKKHFVVEFSCRFVQHKKIFSREVYRLKKHTRDSRHKHNFSVKRPCRSTVAAYLYAERVATTVWSSLHIIWLYDE